MKIIEEMTRQTPKYQKIKSRKIKIQSVEILKIYPTSFVFSIPLIIQMEIQGFLISSNLRQAYKVHGHHTAWNLLQHHLQPHMYIVQRLHSEPVESAKHDLLQGKQKGLRRIFIEPLNTFPGSASRVSTTTGWWLWPKSLWRACHEP